MLKSAILIISLAFAMSTWGQEGGPQSSETPQSASKSSKTDSSQNPDDRHPASLVPGVFLRNLAGDQRDIWSSPFKIRVQDLNWLVPLAGVTAGLINADSELSSRISNTGRLAKHSSTVSNAGLSAALGGAGGLYLLGRWHGNDHQRETGILSGEAAINAFLIDEVFKVATQRQRPSDGTGQGRFWHGTAANSSFPSNHAMLTWSVASVLAHEYPSPLTRVLVYGLATGVSVARVTGKQHFPSDVAVGSALGWMIGRQLYVKHHDAELEEGAALGTFHSSSETGKDRFTDSVFSPYVPLDSWVYQAFDRLAALGVTPSSFQGMKPWTRHECARLLEEASDEVNDQEPDEASRLYAVLANEFATELRGLEPSYIGIDSLYARAMSISGPPLTDGYHFNKTVPYDYGRPYERGMNYVTGFSSSASAGALGFYVRGEYEHAPSAPGVSQAIQDAIQVADSKPIGQPATPIAAFNRPRLIEAYVSLNLNGWQASFGKQSLWTAPTRDPFMFSNNAEPLYMFRVDQTSPRKLPSFLGLLGPYRIEFFFAQITGHHYFIDEDGITVVSLGRTLSKQPMMHSEKISFKPTPNFEFGVSRTVMWGGPGIPITLDEVRRTLFSFNNPNGPNAAALDPGNQNSYFNWSYRLPGLRKWLMLYEDSFVEDEASPIGYPRRSAHNPGLYLTQLPKLHQIDLRVEGGYTDLPNLIQPPAGGFFYWNVGYVDGDTNKGNIMGSTIGRQGVSLRAATTYWVASDKTIQLSYRNMETSAEFLHGGNLRDLELHSDWSLRPGLMLTSMLQYEWWNFPLLTSGAKRKDFTASFQLTYWPHWSLRSRE